MVLSLILFFYSKLLRLNIFVGFLFRFQEFLYAGRKGWLVNLLKTCRAKDKAVRPLDADDVDDDDLDPIEYTADEAAQDVEYLKMTPFNKDTANLIEEKLKLTSMYRHNLINGPGVNVVKQFPFMICHPHLVIYFGFNLLYRNKLQYFFVQILLDYSFMDSNCTAFTSKWPIYSNHVLATLAIYEKDADFFTPFSTDIEPIIALLKLVTPKPKNRPGKRNNDNWFQKVVDDFITFLPVSTETMKI